MNNYDDEYSNDFNEENMGVSTDENSSEILNTPKPNVSVTGKPRSLSKPPKNNNYNSVFNDYTSNGFQCRKQITDPSTSVTIIEGGSNPNQTVNFRENVYLKNFFYENQDAQVDAYLNNGKSQEAFLADVLGENYAGGKIVYNSFSGTTIYACKYGVETLVTAKDENGEHLVKDLVVTIGDTGKFINGVNDDGRFDFSQAALEGLKEIDGKVVFYCHHEENNSLTFDAYSPQEMMATHRNADGSIEGCRQLQQLLEAGVDTYVADVHWENNKKETVGYGPHAATFMTFEKVFYPLITGAASDDINYSDYIDFHVPEKNADGAFKQDGNGVFCWTDASDEDLKELFGDYYVKYISDQFSDLSNTTSSSTTGENLLSLNLASVLNSMNAINESIVGTQYNKTTPDLMEGENGFAGSLSGGVNALYGSTSSALGNLAQDVVSILSIAQCIQDMDASLASDANTLNAAIASNEEIQTMLGGLSHPTINADVFESNFDLFPNSAVEGGVGIVSIDTISTMVSTLKNNLNADTDDANATKAALSDFISKLGKDYLIGPVWDEVSKVASEYENIMNLRIQANQILDEAMQRAETLIKDYMAPDTSLDDSKLPELREELMRIEAQIRTTEGIISYMKAHPYHCTPYYDADGNYLGQSCSGYASGEISSHTAALEEYKIAYNELNILIHKLEGLAGIMVEAQNIINEAMTTIKNSYVSAVGDITPAAQSEFIG